MKSAWKSTKHRRSRCSRSSCAQSIALLMILTLLLCSLSGCLGKGEGEGEPQDTSSAISEEGVNAPGYWEEEGSEMSLLGTEAEGTGAEEIRMAVVREESLLPWKVQTEGMAYLWMLVADPLFVSGSEGILEGRIARSYVSSIEDSAIDILLRSDLKFHNGKKITAKDVVYTINMLKSEKNVFSEAVKDIISCEVLNTYKIRLIMNGCSALHLYEMSFPIVPENWDRDDLMMGSGMYRMEEPEARKEWSFSAYQSCAFGVPLTKRLTVYQVEDEAQVLDCFTSTRTNVYMSETVAYGLYSNKANYEIHESDSYEAMYLEFNLTSPFSGVLSNRQKVAYAIDARSILQQVSYGRGIITETPVKPGTIYQREAQIVYGYDQPMAAEIRTMGESTLTLLASAEDPLVQAALPAILRQLQQAGLEVTVVNEGYFDIALRKETVTYLRSAQIINQSALISNADNENLITSGVSVISRSMIENLPVYGLFFLSRSVVTGYGIHMNEEMEGLYEGESSPFACMRYFTVN